MQTRRFEDRVALVTGGSAGIGKAICERLAGEGARVAVLDLDEERGRHVADIIQKSGGRAIFCRLDVSKEGDVERTVAAVVSELGGLDVVVNNAGISGANKPTHELSAEEWREVMRVNAEGLFFVTKHAIPYLRSQQRGSIVNLSSIYGIVGAPDLPPYHASKAAVREMTKVDALYYAQDGIRVNSVHPGFIWTPLVEELAERSSEGKEAFRRQLDQLHPIGHIGAPEDVAAGVAFLASDDARFITGSELVIDGGYTCR